MHLRLAAVACAALTALAPQANAARRSLSEPPTKYLPCQRLRCLPVEDSHFAHPDLCPGGAHRAWLPRGPRDDPPPLAWCPDGAQRTRHPAEPRGDPYPRPLVPPRGTVRMAGLIHVPASPTACGAPEGHSVYLASSLT